MYLLKYKFLLIVPVFCFKTICATPQNYSRADSIKDKPLISTDEFKDFEKNKNNNSSNKILDSLKKSSAGNPLDTSVEYQQAYVKYEIGSLDHRRRVFEWQLVSSKYIFYTVITVVFLGLLLSAWQFYLPIYRYNKSAKKRKTEKQKPEEAEVKQNKEEENKEVAASTIKLGKDGIEITSHVIGLLILFISIAFFFLYLNYVYPISEIHH